MVVLNKLYGVACLDKWVDLRRAVISVYCCVPLLLHLNVCGVERRVLLVMYKCTSLIGGVSYKCIHILCHGMNFSQVLNQCSKLCNDSDLHSIPFAL